MSAHQPLWWESLLPHLPASDFGTVTDNPVFQRTIVIELFRDVIRPGLTLINDVIELPENYTVCVRSKRPLLKCFQNKVFQSLPVPMQCVILDLLYVILKRSTYDVVRFRCFDQSRDDKTSVVRLMLQLLSVRKGDLGVCQRAVRLIGLLGAAGVHIRDLKQILRFLRKPSELSMSMLQALKNMITLDDTIMKAFPTSFFNLGGAGAGLFITKTTWPFPREYQVTLWFRLEGEQEPEGAGVDCAHLFTCTNASGEGVDVTINKRRLGITLKTSSDERVMLSPGDSDLHPGVWYNFTITHMRPRLSLFGRDEFSVTVDFHEVFKEYIRYPSASMMGELAEFSIGRNFDGQIGTVYLLHESLPATALQALGKHDANKVSEVQRNSVFGTVVAQSSAPVAAPPPDISGMVIGERRTLGSRAVAVFHAARCVNNFALDIHGGRHAKLGRNTQSWTMASARDVISSLGGLPTLMPLFPRLLIENDTLRHAVAMKTMSRLHKRDSPSVTDRQLLRRRIPSEPRIPNIFSTTRQQQSIPPEANGAHLGLGLPLSVLNADPVTLNQFGQGIQALFRSHDAENNECGVLALLLSIFSRCLRGHIQNQREMQKRCLVEMIEYAIYSTPQMFLRFEGEHAVLALLSLKSAVATIATLEVTVTNRLIGNFKLWSRSSFQLQSLLMSVLKTSVRANPVRLVKILGIQRLFDTLVECYMHEQIEDLHDERAEQSLRTRDMSLQGLTIEEEDEKSRSDSVHAEEGHSLKHMSHSIDFDDFGAFTPNPLLGSTGGSVGALDDIDGTSHTHTPTPTYTHAHSHSYTDSISSTEDDSHRSKPTTTSSLVQRLYGHDVPLTKSSSFMSIKEGGQGQVPANAPQAKKMLFQRTISKMDKGQDRTQTDRKDELKVEERKELRQSLLAMILVMLQHSPSEEDIRPVINFMGSCTDETVLSEVSELLLQLLTDERCSRTVMERVTAVLGGITEFAAFVLHRLIQRPSEDLRYWGIRLLTHYFMRCDHMIAIQATRTYTPLLSTIALKFEKCKGIDRLEACGGLSVLSQYLHMFKADCGSKTYVSLLEMLMTRPTVEQNQELLVTFTDMIEGGTSMAAPQFQPAKITAEDIFDESHDLSNECVIPLFFTILPTLPVTLQGRVYMHLLNLVKTSESNRDILVSFPGWQASLYGMVRQLTFINSACMCYVPVSVIATRLSRTSQLVDKLRNSSHMYILDEVRVRRHFLLETHDALPPAEVYDEVGVVSEDKLNTWFDLGMKVYSSLVMHQLQKGYEGLEEVRKVLSLSLEGLKGEGVMLAVMSHFMNDISFKLNSMYEEIKKMSSASTQAEKDQAASGLDALLALLTDASTAIVGKVSVSVRGLTGFSLASSRLEYAQQLIHEVQEKRCAAVECDEHSHFMCESSNDRCSLCGHATELHPPPIDTLELTNQILGDVTPTSEGLGDGDGFGMHPSTRWIDGKIDPNKLGPLERGFELETGRLTLVLQVLRYLDNIFWPQERGPMRNVKLMDRSTGLNEDWPVITAGLRLSLYVLQDLIPTNEQSALNVRRLRELIHTMKMIHMKDSNRVAVDYWVCAVLAHIMEAFRKVKRGVAEFLSLMDEESSEAIHESLCETDDISLSSEPGSPVTPPKETEIESPTARRRLTLSRYYEEMPEFLTRLKEDQHRQDVITTHFDKSEGRNLLLYVKELFDVVMDLYEDHTKLLSEALRQKNFVVLTLLVQSRKNDELQQETRRGRDGQDEDRSKLESSENSLLLEPDNPMRPSNASGERMSEPSNSCAVIDSVISACKWLSDPLLKVDLLKCEAIVQALIEVEAYEEQVLTSVYDQLKIYGKTCLSPVVLDQRIDDTEELQKLGTIVLQSMSSREMARETMANAMFQAQLRSAASHWQKCLRRSSYEWSPWTDNNTDVKWKLSKHTDNKMRRMLLVQNHHYWDHKDAAYQDNSRSRRESRSFMKLKTLMNAVIVDITREKSGLEDEEDDGWHQSGAGSDASSFLEGTKGMMDGRDDKNSDASPASKDRRPEWSTAFEWSSDERIVIETEAQQVIPGSYIVGTLLLSTKHLYFHPRKRERDLQAATKPLKDRRWRLERLCEMYGRRYLLQNCGIELFFADAAGVFFSFDTVMQRETFFIALRKQATPLLAPYISLNPKHVFKNSPWTDKWRRRLISNFEYLMRLNIIAGRSYNDITQYPVFPWVLADYTSTTIDLNDPSVYRDLTKPIGALNEERLSEFQERYKCFDDPVVPKFLYGSHYSSAGVVLHYLVRQEPFSTLAISLQGGKFDCPDRLFFDLQASWESCNRSMSDVKELIPEMFCCPEILINSNGFPLGTLQDDKGIVNDVKLPPWAADPFDFIRINRDALESEYVSMNLHHWIDLVFGYKQRGEEAVKALNVFYYLTYEGAVDIGSIADELQREATKAQVTHFGQTPSQILTRPHPQRLPKEECVVSMCSDPSSLSKLQVFTPERQMGSDGSRGPVIAVSCLLDKLVVLHTDLSLCLYRWTSFPDGAGNPFSVRPDRARQLPSASLSVSSHTFQETDTNSVSDASPRSTTSEQVLRFPLRLARAGVDTILRTPPAEQARKAAFFVGAVFGFQRGEPASSPAPLPSPSDVHTEEQQLYNRSSSLDIVNSTSNELGFGSGLGLDMYDTASMYSSNGSTVFIDPGQTMMAQFEHFGPDEKERHSASTYVPVMGPWSVGLAVGGPDASGGKVITCGYWDNSIKCHSLDARELDSASATLHSRVRCIEYGKDKNILITGGADGACRVWVVDHPNMAAALSDELTPTASEANDKSNEVLQCIHVLCGHDSAVTSLSYSPELDMLVSGAEAGTICLHSVRKGKFVRTVSNLVGQSVDLLLLTQTGYFVAHSWSDGLVHLFSLNGHKIMDIHTTQRLSSLAINATGNVLVCGGEDGGLTLLTLHNLTQVHMIDLSLHGAVRCLWFSEDDQYLFIGSDDGSFSICTDPDVRWRMIQAAIQKTPLLGQAF